MSRPEKNVSCDKHHKMNENSGYINYNYNINEEWETPDNDNKYQERGGQVLLLINLDKICRLHEIRPAGFKWGI